MVRINGEEKEMDPMSIAQCLALCGYDANRVVVECNLEIIPREAWEDTMIQDGDIVEVLRFVGGG